MSAQLAAAPQRCFSEPPGLRPGGTARGGCPHREIAWLGIRLGQACELLEFHFTKRSTLRNCVAIILGMGIRILTGSQLRSLTRFSSARRASLSAPAFPLSFSTGSASTSLLF